MAPHDTSREDAPGSPTTTPSSAADRASAPPRPLQVARVACLRTHFHHLTPEGFASAERRDRLAAAASLATPPRVFAGTIGSERALRALLARSAFGDGRAEGLVLRLEREGRVVARAKVRAPGFHPVTDEQWRAGRPRNRLADRS